MNKKYTFVLLGTVFFMFHFFVPLKIATAKVIIYDNVVAMGNHVTLKAFAKGWIFPEGGELVKFYLNGKHIGTTLSGGDGYAFLKHLPLIPGINHLRVEKDIDTDKGTLLVIKKNEKVVLLEIESTLFEYPFVPQPAKESKVILTLLAKKFKLIYVSSLIGAKESKEWLKKNNYPHSVVLKWNANQLDVLKEKGIKPYAIIGSSSVLSEASNIQKKYSFEETENGMSVKNWKELGQRLKEEAEKNGEP